MFSYVLHLWYCLILLPRTIFKRSFKEGSYFPTKCDTIHFFIMIIENVFLNPISSGLKQHSGLPGGGASLSPPPLKCLRCEVEMKNFYSLYFGIHSMSLWRKKSKKYRGVPQLQSGKNPKIRQFLPCKYFHTYKI